MSHAEAPTKTSRREMRKALVRLRMEMHRQEIRQESRQLVNPLSRVRGLGQGVTAGLGIKHAPLWGIAGVLVLGFLTGKGARSKAGAEGKSGGLSRMIKLTTTLMPLIRMAMGSSNRS